MGKAYSKEIRAAVIEARLTGMLVKDICRKFHVCDQTIRDWMKADANVVGRTSLKKHRSNYRLMFSHPEKTGVFLMRIGGKSLNCIKQDIPSQISANRCKSEEVHCIAGSVSIPNSVDTEAKSLLQKKFLPCEKKIACCGKKTKFCNDANAIHAIHCL